MQQSNNAHDEGEGVHVKNLKSLRILQRETQSAFWYRFGVSQSRGSRFEQGVRMPSSVAILLGLYLEKKVNDEDLLDAIDSSKPPMALQRKVEARVRGADIQG